MHSFIHSLIFAVAIRNNAPAFPPGGLFIVIKGRGERGDVGTFSCNIRKGPGWVWRGLETAVPGFKTEIRPRQGSDRSVPPPRRSPAREPYVHYFQEFLFGTGAKEVGGGALDRIHLGTPRFGPRQPPKMSLGSKGSRVAGHPQRPVSQESRGPAGPDTSLEKSHLGPI